MLFKERETEMVYELEKLNEKINEKKIILLQMLNYT